MREIFGWALWVWRRWDTWQKLWIVAMFFVGAGTAAEGTAQTVLWAIPMAIFGFYLLKWAVWDAVRSSWANYKQHRNELLTTIRDADK